MSAEAEAEAEEVRYDTSWSSQQLCDHLLKLNVISREEYNVLKDQRIDGLTFLKMNESNISELGFLLGPKIKILSFIHNIKQEIEVKCHSNETKTAMKTENGCGDVRDGDHRLVIATGSGKVYQCSECGKAYSKRQYVMDHIRTIHCNRKDNYSCRVCGQVFGWRVTVLKHIKKAHPEKKSSAMIEELF